MHPEIAKLKTEYCNKLENNELSDHIDRSTLFPEEPSFGDGFWISDGNNKYFLRGATGWGYIISNQGVDHHTEKDFIESFESVEELKKSVESKYLNFYDG